MRLPVTHGHAVFPQYGKVEVQQKRAETRAAAGNSPGQNHWTLLQSEPGISTQNHCNARTSAINTTSTRTGYEALKGLFEPFKAYYGIPWPNTGLAISDSSRSVPQLLLYHLTVPELTLKPALNSQDSYLYLYLHLPLHLYLYLYPL